MQLSQLFANVTNCNKELRPTSKQEFFATKRNIKRMKVSACFSQPIEKLQQDNSCLDLSYDSVKTDQLFKNCRKELESTFGEDITLAFKVKPLKRKKNIKAKIKSNGKTGEQSQSDCETPVVSPLKQVSHKIIEKHEFQNLFQQKAEIFQTGQFKISDFHILNKIGEGTYSQVYKAVDKATGFICALKVLQKWKMRELKVEENVIRQIKINAFLDHPNISKLYSCFHDQNYIYLICQYATDKTLFDFISQPKYKIKLRKGLLTQQASKIVGQICNAVGYIHKHSVLHRDIKPQNILLTLFDTIKICDFGWSVYNPSKQMRNTLCGTPLYLAPELVAQTQYDESVDVWAIGVLTYEMLTEQSPFKITQLRDLSKILYDQIQFEGIRNKMAIQFMQKAMEKDPNRRHSIFELIHHPFITSSNQHFLPS